MPIGSISQALKLTHSGITIDSSLSYHFSTVLPDYFVGYNTQYYDSTGSLYSLSDTEFESFATFSPRAEGATTRSFDGFASAAAITFSPVATDAADIVLFSITKQIYTATGGEVYGFAHPPTFTGPTQYDVVLAPPAASDSWINVVVQHELGHSIGLKDVKGTGAPIYSGDEDNGRYTMMSYERHQGTLTPVYELQLYDVAAVQSIYGRNDSFNAGNTPISGFIEALGPNVGADRAFAIWDGGGVDTINASGLGQAALIDLRPGYFSSIGNLTGVSVSAGISPVLNNAGELNISIAYGAYIENAIGTSQADFLIGNILSNTLDGGGGDDVIYAEGNNSIHDAGDGSYDRVTVGGAEAPALAVQLQIANPELQSDMLSGGEGNDSLYGGRGSDVLSGGAGNDHLRGGAGNDTLAGDDGDDFFYAEKGDDEIWGGGTGFDIGMADGIDTIDYSANLKPIEITFDGSSTDSTIRILDGAGGTDTLKSIERIIGTSGYDVVQINGEIKSGTELTIDGNGGQAPNAYGSILNGSSSTKKLKIKIHNDGTGYIRSVGGGQIDLEGFHTQAIGTALDDEITDASNGKKRLDGGAGNDIISTAGSTGNATIYGGDGDDTITGGSGNDIIFGDFSYLWENYTNVLSGGAGSDLIISTSENDTIDGGADADHIRILYAGTTSGWNISNEISVEGGEGNDVIEVTGGLFGIDVILNAGDGHDTLQVRTPQDMGAYWRATDINVQMGGITSAGDFKIIVDAAPGTGGYFRGLADVALVNNITGDSIYLSNQFLYIVEEGEGNYSNFSHITVNDMWHGDYIYQYGSVASYITDLSDFDDATAPDSGDTDGTSGDDTLSGGHGDDILSGGDGNDVFETSGGDDIIDGGAGTDTLNLFGSRSHFTVSGYSSSMTLTDGFGREGEITATGIERVFFVGDGEMYNVGDLFGYYGTPGNDEIAASNRDNEIFGLDGNDTINALGGDDVIDGGEGDDLIDGGDGNDIANYSGSSTDYIVTRLLGGGATIETTGLGINDGTDTLQGVESIYFAGDDVTLDLSTLPLGGTNGDDILIGGDGDEVIEGGDGDDLLQGGAGYDVLNGGNGNDTAYYAGKSTDYSIYLWTDGGVYIDDYSESGTEGYDELIDIENLYFAGDDTMLQIPGDLPPLGTSGNDVILGTNRHDTLVGLEGSDVLTDNLGNDYLDGGEGADTMTGGEGDDRYIVDDSGDVIVENADEGYDTVETSFSYTLGANLESLSLWNEVTAIDGTGNALDNNISGDDFGNTLLGMDGDDVLTGSGGNDVLDGGNGSDTAYYYGLFEDFEAFREADGSVTVVDSIGSQGQDTLHNIEQLIFSYWDNVVVNVADLPLRGTSGNDVLTGAAGNDKLFGLEGDDRLIGGAGDDVLDGGTGSSDVAVFTGTQASHTIATNSGVVTITDNQPSTDGDGGVDTVVGIEIAEFKGGVQVGITSPIVLDLNGDGVSLVNNRDTNVSFDWDGDGLRNQTGWVGRDDGFLMFDRDGNGTVSNGGELSFTGDKPGAKSDLDGLRAFDSNGDGHFSSADETFGSFRIWRDANGNGTSETSEISSLGEAGVASIALTGQAVNQTWAWGDNITINNGSYIRTDGSTASFEDVALNYDVAQGLPAHRPLNRHSLRGADFRDWQVDREYSRDPIAPWRQMGGQSNWSGPAVVAIDDLDHYVSPPAVSSSAVSSIDRRLAIMVQEMNVFGVQSAGENFQSWHREGVRPVDFFA